MDLFPADGPVVLNMVDAEIHFYACLENLGDHSELLRTLVEQAHWRQDEITVFGKTHPSPRLVAWYGDRGCRYSYSGISHDPQPWTADLERLRDLVAVATGSHFNSVLLNYYRDHRDSMGLHADDEPELGPEPVIASLSLGEERTLLFKHRHRRDLDSVKVPLPAGSLLVMKGATQRNWKHGINKLSRPCGPRLNLTFRHILVPAGS